MLVFSSISLFSIVMSGINVTSLHRDKGLSLFFSFLKNLTAQQFRDDILLSSIL